MEVTYQGVTYDVQPFFKNQSSDSWLFAKVGTAGGWSAPLVYDAVDGCWYRALGYDGEKTGASDISSFSDANALHEAMTTERQPNGGKPKWEKVSDDDLSFN